MKAITGATLIDGRGGSSLPNATVLVEGGRIVAAGASAQVDVPDGAEVVQARGLTLLPGLIDCHDHLANFGYEIASRWGLTETQALRNMRVASVLRQTLESGYTTVRDAGGLAAGFRDAVDEGLVPGPRLQVALNIISPTGGIGDHISASGYGHPAEPDPALPPGVANGPDAMRAKVREMVQMGADVIKTATTGGASSRAGLGPKDMLVSRAELEALIDEAHGLGRRVMCHALGGPGLRAGVELGANSIEHGAYLDEDPDLLALMAERDCYLVPTFGVYTFHATRGTPHGRERSAELREHHVRSLNMALEAGVKVVAGTDEGGWEHGNNAHELTCLVEAGMSPMQAIVAGTSVAAECLGLDGVAGSIEAGKSADLLLVDSDPLLDISTLERGESVVLVMKGGEAIVDRRSDA